MFSRIFRLLLKSNQIEILDPENELRRQVYSSDVIKQASSIAIFCYDYVDSVQSGWQKNIYPPKSVIFNRLKNENISDADYLFAQRLLVSEKCNSIGDYMMLFLMIDATLLAKIVNFFRHVSSDEFILDPEYLITLPSLVI